MATVTGFTAARTLLIEDATIVDGDFDASNHLILVTQGGPTVDAGTLPTASLTVSGVVELATTGETTTGTDAVRATTPAGVAAAISAAAVPTATDTVQGKVELATDAETITGTDTARATTPAGVAAALAAYVPQASDTVQGKVELATTAEAITGTDTVRAVTPAGLAAYAPQATTSTQGKVELATTAEAIAGTDTARAVTPEGLAAYAPTATTSAQGKVELATNAEAVTGTDTARAVTPAGLDAAIDDRFPAQNSDIQSTSGTTTSVTFTPTLTGGVAAGHTFVAPASGKVIIFNTCQIVNSGANNSRCGFFVRDGASVGAGTTVLASSDNRSILVGGTNEIRATIIHPLTGLTPGATYNVQQEFKVSAGTGTYSQKSLCVIPTQ